MNNKGLNNKGLNHVGPLILDVFSIVNTTVLHDLQLVESADANMKKPQIRRNHVYQGGPTAAYRQDFDCVDDRRP